MVRYKEWKKVTNCPSKITPSFFGRAPAYLFCQFSCHSQDFELAAKRFHCLTGKGLHDRDKEIKHALTFLLFVKSPWEEFHCFQVATLASASGWGDDCSLLINAGSFVLSKMYDWNILDLCCMKLWMRLLLDPNHSFGSARQTKSKTLVIQDLQILIEEAVHVDSTASRDGKNCY